MVLYVAPPGVGWSSGHRLTPMGLGGGGLKFESQAYVY